MKYLFATSNQNVRNAARDHIVLSFYQTSGILEQLFLEVLICLEGCQKTTI